MNRPVTASLRLCLDPRPPGPAVAGAGPGAAADRASTGIAPGPAAVPEAGQRDPGTGATQARHGTERGSGTVLAVGLIAVLLALTLALAGVVQVQSGVSRARAGADLAALAGATALTSVHAPGNPCATAGRVAGANGATLASCRVEGEDVVVSVSVAVSVLGLARTATASARAGPVPTPS